MQTISIAHVRGDSKGNENLARLPDFIVGGGMAAGTSFLSSLLAQHPAIYLPAEQRPEPNFFHYSWKYENGLDWYADRWFADIANEQIVCERSSLYLTSNVAARRIHEALPNVKLAFCLRNPIERAWGAYRFTALEGLETLPFIDALESEEQRIAEAQGIWAEVQPHAYLARSRYAAHVEEWSNLFGGDRLMFIKSEDLGRRPEHWLGLICQFVGVEPMHSFELPPNFTSPSVVDLDTQAELRTFFGDRFSEIVENVRTLQPIDESLVSKTERDALEALKRNLTTAKTPMPDIARRFLEERLSGEIAELRGMLGFEVDDWV